MYLREKVIGFLELVYVFWKHRLLDEVTKPMPDIRSTSCFSVDSQKQLGAGLEDATLPAHAIPTSQQCLSCHVLPLC